MKCTIPISSACSFRPVPPSCTNAHTHVVLEHKTQLLLLQVSTQLIVLKTASQLYSHTKHGVVLDEQLCCNTNITSVARSCRKALNSICRSWPFLTRDAAQILVQALVITRLLQLSPVWTPLCRNETLTTHSEHSSAPGVQLTKILLCNPPLLQPPLAPGNRSHQIQDTGTGLHGYQQPYLPPNSQTPHPSPGTLLNNFGWYHQLVPHSPRTGKHRSAKSQLFSVLAPQWWNELPADVRMAVTHQLPQDSAIMKLVLLALQR